MKTSLDFGRSEKMKQSKILFISIVFGTLFVSQMSGNVALKSPLTIKATLDGNLTITTESKKAAGVPASYPSSVSTIKSVNGLDFSNSDAFQTNAAVFVLQIAAKAYNNLLLEKNLRDYQSYKNELAKSNITNWMSAQTGVSDIESASDTYTNVISSTRQNSESINTNFNRRIATIESQLSTNDNSTIDTLKEGINEVFASLTSSASGTYTDIKYTNLNNETKTTDVLTAIKSDISALNVNIGEKQATLTGAATTITSSNLTASKILVSSSSGKVAASSTDSSKLNYLSDVTSNIQSQISSKQAALTTAQKNAADSGVTATKVSSYDAHIAKTSGNPHNVTKSDVGLGNVDNTSDANKPVSTAMQTALDKKVDAVSTFSSNGSVGNSVQIPVISYSKQGLITAVSTTAPAITINGTSRSSWTIRAGANVDIATDTTSGTITVNAVLPAIKVDSSTGAITDSNGASINVSIFSLTSGVAASATQVSTLEKEADGTYMLNLDGYIPKVATVASYLGAKSYS